MVAKVRHKDKTRAGDDGAWRTFSAAVSCCGGSAHGRRMRGVRRSQERVVCRPPLTGPVGHVQDTARTSSPRPPQAASRRAMHTYAAWPCPRSRRPLSYGKYPLHLPGRVRNDPGGASSPHTRRRLRPITHAPLPPSPAASMMMRSMPSRNSRNVMAPSLDQSSCSGRACVVGCTRRHGAQRHGTWGRQGGGH